jgi:hypothetical protein
MQSNDVADESDRQLLDDCLRKQPGAVPCIVDRYLPIGIAAARRFARAHADSEQMLDAVHDALITAFDEAVDTNAGSIRPTFSRLLHDFIGSEPVDFELACDSASDAVMSANVRQLRQDLIEELSLTIAIRRGSPRGWRRALSLLEDISVIRRRMRRHLDDLRTRLPTVTMEHEVPRMSRDQATRR